MLLKVVFYIFSTFLITATVMPLTRKDHWTFKVCEFPRIQKLVLVLLTLLISLFIFEHSWIFITCFSLVVLVLFMGLYQVYPFTRLAPKTLRDADPGADNYFRLLIANVYQYNDDFDRLNKLIDQVDPDLLLLVETDHKWQQALQQTTNRFTYRLEYPQDNTYGMLFYSRFKMRHPEIRFLLSDDVPSMRMSLEMPDGQKILFFGLHPPPPSPTQKTYSTERDYELLLIAREASRRAEPVLVAGDLNDVAWSYTTDRFVDISGLKDPRKGRGIYSTFHAKNILMRWPLDHIFCSEHFRLVNLKRQSKIGSDHFPVLVELALPRRQRK